MRYYFVIILSSLWLTGCIEPVAQQEEETTKELYGLPAKRYNTPEKRMKWWNSLDWRWQTVFCQMSRNRSSSICKLTDEEIKKLFVTEKMVVSNYLNVGVKLENLSGLSGLTNLKELSVLDQSILISEFTKLPHLQYLHIDQNNVDLRAWGKRFPNVNSLWLEGKNLITLKGIHHFSNLERLTFNRSNITSLATANKLKKLKDIDAVYNLLTNLQGIENAPSLEVLNVSHNRLTSVEGIETVPNLRELDISDNPNLKDLTPILQCKRLKVLKMSGLSAKQMTQLSKGMPQLRIINPRVDSTSKGF